MRGLAREENPAAILKLWEEHDLLETVHPVLAKKHPDYDSINRLSKVRDDLFMAGLRPRLATPMMLAILGRLKDREQGSLLHKLGFRAAEVERILGFEEEAHASAKELAGKKLAAPIDAFRYLEKMPVETLAHLLAFSSNSGAVSKIRAYLNKWRPLRQDWNRPTQLPTRIPNGVARIFSPDGPAAPGEYVLAVGTLEPRKNLAFAQGAARRLGRRAVRRQPQNWQPTQRRLLLQRRKARKQPLRRNRKRKRRNSFNKSLAVENERLRVAILAQAI